MAKKEGIFREFQIPLPSPFSKWDTIPLFDKEGNTEPDEEGEFMQMRK